jgi:hypothetical protein
MDQEPDEEEVEKFRSICSSSESTEQPRLIGANLTSPASPILDEGVGHEATATPMMVEELEGVYFHQEPLDVGDGIAVLEESVELAIPDVITQI